MNPKTKHGFCVSKVVRLRAPKNIGIIFQQSVYDMLWISVCIDYACSRADLRTADSPQILLCWSILKNNCASAWGVISDHWWLSSLVWFLNTSVKETWCAITVYQLSYTAIVKSFAYKKWEVRKHKFSIESNDKFQIVLTLRECDFPEYRPSQKLIVNNTARLYN